MGAIPFRHLRLVALFAVALVAAAPVTGQQQQPAPASSAPTPRALAPEDFAELPFLADPQLSPDGARIAARIINGSHERIGIWQLAAPREAPPQIVAIDDVESFAWAGDSRLLVETLSFGIRASGNAIAYGPSRTILAYDLAENEVTQLSQSRGLFSDTIFIDPHGRYALIAGQPTLQSTPNVVRVDIDTGASVEVQRRVPGVWSWFADSNGIIRVGIDYETRGARIYYRNTPEAPLRRVETRRDLRDDSVVDTIRFVTNTDRGVIITNAATGRFGVYDYDFATDTRGAAIFEHPEVDVTSAMFGPGGAVEGVQYQDDRPRVHWLDPDMAALQRQIDRTFPERTNLVVNRSRDLNRVLIFSTAANDPGTYYVFDRAARRMEMFASPYTNLHGRAFAPVRPLSYQSRDGVRIPGYLTLPPGGGERGLPLVVLPHGGPFIRSGWDFDTEVQMLASLGYAVLQPNFRGSTGYGRDHVARGYGQLGSGMIDDMEDGIAWLASQGIVDPTRVCIMGSSYGGYAAVWAAMRSPERYRCAISFAGPSDLRAMLRYNANPFIPRRYVRAWRQRIEGEERIDLNAISPFRQPERLRVPLLLAHGANDYVVPAAQSQQLAEALRRHNAPVETVYYRKSGHGFTDSVEAADYYRRVAAFLAQHNPADGAARPTGQADPGAENPRPAATPR
ncbi:alpha/beta hydrolase family protein [Sphingosinicella sp.]|uniref:alpha/beta hydrolase family protein n=1 Tax=Sphingosinicella sp. TaxID=1917971 RepID=UPI00403806C0